jgi:hypothetical protein
VFGNSIIYLIFAAIAGIAFLIVVPKEQYKRYLLWGLIFGGLGNATLVPLLSSLNLIQYKNMGPFSIFGLFSIWTPLTWAFVFSTFFYLMPVRKVFLVPYILLWVALTYSVGLVMQNFGLFEYIGIHKFLAVPTFLLWYTVSTWVYLKYDHIYLR